MKKTILAITIFITGIILVGCNFSEEKTYDLENPTRVAFLGLDVLDILNEVKFENTGIKEMGMLFKGNVDYLDKFNDDSKVIDLGTHNAINYDELIKLAPELIILSSRTQKFKDDLAKAHPNAEIYDATHGISKGELIDTLNKNVEFLSSKFPLIKNELETQLAEIKTSINEIKTKSNDTQALVILLSAGKTSSYDLDSRFGMIYKEFGFIIPENNISGDNAHGDSLSFEAIKEINPEVIFVLDRSATIGDEVEIDFNAFTSNSLIKNTIAGENNNIFQLNGNAWYMTSGGFKSTRQMIRDISQFLK